MPVGPSAELETETCRTLLDIWSDARGHNLMPHRSDIEAAALKTILPQIAIVVVGPPGANNIKLAGTAYRDIFGFEPTSRSLINVTPPEIRRLRAYRFHMGATHPCGGLAILSHAYANGASDRLEFLALPLEADVPGDPRMMICAIESILGRRWRNDTSDEIIGGPAESFRFVDIGAGIPANLEPPVDFALGTGGT